MAYPGMESALLEAWQRYKQSANRVSFAESRSAHPPVEQISSVSEKANQIDDLRSGRKVS
jgi:putative transposase